MGTFWPKPSFPGFGGHDHWIIGRTDSQQQLRNKESTTAAQREPIQDNVSYTNSNFSKRFVTWEPAARRQSQQLGVQPQQGRQQKLHDKQVNGSNSVKTTRPAQGSSASFPDPSLPNPFPHPSPWRLRVRWETEFWVPRKGRVSGRKGKVGSPASGV